MRVPSDPPGKNRRPVVIVSVERIAKRSGWLVKIACSAVYKINVHPAVIVVVEESAARSHRFRYVHFGRLAAHMNP